MKTINLLTVGADPEVFLQSTSSKEIISAEGYIRGSKYDPYPFAKNFCTSLDNVLAEYTIPPAKTVEEFIEYIQTGLSYIDNTTPKDVCVAIIAAANLDHKYLQTLNAMEFGCEPDFNAYSLFKNQRPHAEDTTLRSAAAHIHIGYENPPYFDGDITEYTPNEEHATIVKSMDLHLSIPAVLMEEENKRKELYGKAGAYRPKSYGLEYRTISNFYLRSKELLKWAWDASHQAINALNNGLVFDKALSAAVQHAVNNNDKGLATELVKEYNLQLV